VLTHRIAYLVSTGKAHPGEILAITFTNKAAWAGGPGRCGS
jgi:DNA helicase-2/ATP-dependent DNA helicase PcrA